MERKRLMHVFDKWLLVKSEFQFGLVTYNLKWCIYEPTHELEKHNSGDPLYGFFQLISVTTWPLLIFPSLLWISIMYNYCKFHFPPVEVHINSHGCPALLPSIVYRAGKLEFQFIFFLNIWHPTLKSNDHHVLNRDHWKPSMDVTMNSYNDFIETGLQWI